MLKIIYYHHNRQACVIAASIIRESEKSIRFCISAGNAITIKRSDIISIEEE